MPRFPAPAHTTDTLTATVFSDLAARARRLATPPHPLHVGDTYRLPPTFAQSEMQRESDHPGLHKYGPVAGEPRFLRAASERLRQRSGRSVPLEQIQAMAGATAGLSCIAQTILDPGDEVLLPSPYWPLIRGIVRARGAVPVEVPVFSRLDAPDFDLERALSQARSDRTVALYVNSPNNPSGRVLPPELVDVMAAFAQKHDLWLLSDEAYEELWYTDARPAPVWDHPMVRARAISIHTLSKSYGLAGARVGYCYGPEPIITSLRAVQTHTTYCPATPMQLAGAKALESGDRWLEEARAAYGRAGARTAEALGLAKPEGGTFLFANIEQHLQPGESGHGFLSRCLDAGVILTPGSACGADFSNWVRLGFTSVVPDALDDALRRLAPLFGRSEDHPHD